MQIPKRVYIAEFVSLSNQYGEERAMSILESRATQLQAEYVVDLLNSNRGVIANSVGFITRNERTFLINAINGQIGVAAEIYWMKTDLETCLRRHREYMMHVSAQGLRLSLDQPEDFGRLNLTEQSIHRLHNLSELPVSSEGFNKIFYVTAVSPGQYVIKEQPVKPILTK